jgi:hypothetical protein
VIDKQVTESGRWFLLQGTACRVAMGSLAATVFYWVYNNPDGGSERDTHAVI